jgi:hypothetical protein
MTGMDFVERGNNGSPKLFSFGNRKLLSFTSDVCPRQTGAHGY